MEGYSYFITSKATIRSFRGMMMSKTLPKQLISIGATWTTNTFLIQKGVIFISIPTLLDSSLAPEDKHIIHAFTPSLIKEWENLSREEYLVKKENYFSFIVEKISKIIPNLEKNIFHKEIGTPRTHRKFLGRFEGSYGPIPNKKLFGLLPMPFNTTKIQNLYCVGDSCFPGQGLNAVAFSGFACAHKIGSKLKINDYNLPE